MRLSQQLAIGLLGQPIIHINLTLTPERTTRGHLLSKSRRKRRLENITLLRAHFCHCRYWYTRSDSFYVQIVSCFPRFNVPDTIKQGLESSNPRRTLNLHDTGRYYQARGRLVRQLCKIVPYPYSSPWFSAPSLCLPCKNGPPRTPVWRSFVRRQHWCTIVLDLPDFLFSLCSCRCYVPPAPCS